MSAALFQDPSGSTLAIKSEITLSNAEEVYSPTTAQPSRKASHSRQGSAPKRKRAQSGIDNAINLVESAPLEPNGYDKPKRQKLDAGPTPERVNTLVHPIHQNQLPAQQLAADGIQFSQSYPVPWFQTSRSQGAAVLQINEKDEQREHSVKSSTVPQDAKTNPDSSEHSFPTTPNFKRLFLGRKLVEPWYFSPYPPGDIAVQEAYYPNAQLVNGEYYYPGSRPAKGQVKTAKTTSAGNTQTGAINGFGNNGAGPSRSHARHEAAAHANAPSLYVCERCFAYADRPLSNHICLPHIPGVVLYDNDPPPILDIETAAPASLNHDPLHENGAHLDQRPDKDGRVRIYEVDPVDSAGDKIFCKNITLFGKCFIDSKSIVFDCSTFLYYLITVVEKGVESVAGFFTKEKESAEEYNLACIIVFPPYQKRRLGRLLIQFSYELSKYDGKIGSPEKPLSDLGMRSYAPIWTSMVLDYLHEQIAIPYELLLDRPKGGARRQRNPLGTSRVLKSKEIAENGSASEIHLMFYCTLEQIATGAYLTASDASFALAELGFQQYIAGFKHDDIAQEKGADGAVQGQAASDTNFDANLVAHSHELANDAPENTRSSASNAPGPVPILTRDFVRLLAGKTKFRRQPINKDFVLL